MCYGSSNTVLGFNTGAGTKTMAPRFGASASETAMAGDFILETDGLTKEFRGFVTVNGVRLRVWRGTIHALIGPSEPGRRL